MFGIYAQAIKIKPAGKVRENWTLFYEIQMTSNIFSDIFAHFTKWIWLSALTNRAWMSSLSNRNSYEIIAVPWSNDFFLNMILFLLPYSFLEYKWLCDLYQTSHVPLFHKIRNSAQSKGLQGLVFIFLQATMCVNVSLFQKAPHSVVLNFGEKPH